MQVPGTTTIVNTSKILNTTAAATSSIAGRARNKADVPQQISFAGLDGQNVVIISDTNGFRVLHTQV